MRVGSGGAAEFVMRPTSRLILAVLVSLAVASPLLRLLSDLTRHPRAHSLELELRYDDTRLQYVGVRPINLSDLSLVSARSPQPGRITIAAASAAAFPADGRPLVIVEFASSERDVSPSAVRPFSANVDELVVIGR
jgi:hypothetical protein